MSNNPYQPIYLKCLGCGKKTFLGKRNTQNDSIQCYGLLSHIRQKKDKGTGKRCCYNVYNSLHLVDPASKEIDLSTSIVAQTASTKHPGNDLHRQSAKKQKTSPSFADTEWNFSDDDSLSNEPVHFELRKEHPLSDHLLPKSHSLHHHAKFSTHPDQFQFKINYPDTKIHSSELFDLLNRQTLPSQMLLPQISLHTIYKSAQEILNMEAKALHVLHKIERQVDMDWQLDNLEEEEMELPEDYLEQELMEDQYPPPHPDPLDFLDVDSEDESSVGSNATLPQNNPNPADLPGNQLPANRFVHPQYLLERLQYEQEHKVDPSNLSPEVLSHLELLRIQDQHKLSMSAVSAILDWAHYSVKLQDDIFQEQPPSRENLMSKYRRHVGVPPHAYKFFESLVQWLPDNKPTVLRKRHFLDCVFELLTNSNLLGEKSCNVSLPHPTDPFAPSPPDSPPFVSELHHGYWWSETMKEKCRPGSNDILVPLYFEVDETVIDAQGKLSVTPFNIKLGIFNAETNTKEEASTTWFFLPNDAAEAANHEKTTLAVHKLQNLHSALREGFSELKYIMDNDVKIPWKLYYGGKEHDVNLVFAVAFVISDTAMHDKLCCHYGTRNQGVKCICRHCRCPTRYLVNESKFIDYDIYLPEDLEPSKSDDAGYWKKVSHYPIQNACDELYFGVNPHKIHLATPGEVLHMHQKGGMWRVVESLDFIWRGGKKVTMDNMSTASKQVNIKSSMENFDYLCHQVGRYLSRQSDRDRPRTKFRNSIFAKTKKNAHEQAGVLLCILLAMLTDRGRQVALEERTMEKAVLDNFIYMIELILMLEAWLKQSLFDARQMLDGKSILKAMGYYLSMMNDICKRGGMGALLVKNHLLLHLPDYILRWGPPRLWDSANLERSHKTEAKWPARLTQKRQETFIEQTSTRYSERRIIKRLRRLLGIDYLMSNIAHGSIGKKQSEATVFTGSHFDVGVEDGFNHGAVKWDKHPGRQAHPQCVIDFICASLLWNLPDAVPKKVRGFTEYKTEVEGRGVIFRAHPSFRSTSRQRRDVWYDWGMFDLSDMETFDREPAPGQILAFVHVPTLKEDVEVDGIPIEMGTPHAVVRLFREQPTDKFRGESEDEDDPTLLHPYSYLVRFGKVNESLHLIPLRRLVGTTIVIENIQKHAPAHEPTTAKEISERERLDSLIDPLGRGFFVVRPRCSWAGFFERLIDSYRSSPDQRGRRSDSSLDPT